MVNIIFIFITTLTSSIYPPNYEWIETSQQDFKDGIFEHNLYVSHRFDGAIEFVPRFDLNNDGYIDIFVAPHPYGDNYIYWGDANGYSINRRTSYPGDCGGNCDAADLDCDGYPDFLSCRYHRPDIWIHWGQENGPDPQNPTVLILGGGGNEASLIADFNKDGYLDITVGSYENTSSGLAAVFWGSASGYSSQNRTELPVTIEAGHNLEAADFNKDNWLDLLIINFYDSKNLIYWGSANGFSVNNRTELTYLPNMAHGASTGDLNDDGWLDVVFTGHRDIEEAYVYWGSPTGFQTHQVLDLNEPAFGGSSIRDFNKDGYLDILFIMGGGVYNIREKPRIYWGSQNGYSNSDYTEIGIPVNGSSDFVADFNYDGDLDIYICDLDYTGSYILWGPDFNTYQTIQHSGIENHHPMAREMGNTYNRQYYEEYQSSIFDAGFVANWKNAFWTGYQPTGTEIQMFLRSGNTPNPDSTWLTWIEMANGGNIPDTLNAQYLQYLAKFIYTNPSYLPALDSVKITYLPLVTYHDVGVIDILAPVDTTYAGLTTTPTAKVKNFGGFDENFYVFFNIGCAYADNRLVSLEAGDSAIIKFDPWVAVLGYYNVGVATYLETDENPDNDTMTDWLTVVEPPEDIQLYRPIPNPTARIVAVGFALPSPSFVEITIYNVNGQFVKKLLAETKPVGTYQITTDCRDLLNGVYLVKMKTDKFEAFEKFIVAK